MTAHYYVPDGQAGYSSALEIKSRVINQPEAYYERNPRILARLSKLIAHDRSAVEIIRLARRELAHRYGSRGTVEQLHIAVQILEETRNDAH